MKHLICITFTSFSLSKVNCFEGGSSSAEKKDTESVLSEAALHQTLRWSRCVLWGGFIPHIGVPQPYFKPQLNWGFIPNKSIGDAGVFQKLFIVEKGRWRSRFLK